MFLNGRLEVAGNMTFDNGWTINICTLPCGHNCISVVPTYISENLTTLPRETFKEYDREKMVARGDAWDHFKGDDGELLDIIVSVASRPTEPLLEKTRHDILKVARYFEGGADLNKYRIYFYKIEPSGKRVACVSHLFAINEIAARERFRLRYPLVTIRKVKRL
jgi:hypothetical protein